VLVTTRNIKSPTTEICDQLNTTTDTTLGGDKISHLLSHLLGMLTVHESWVSSSVAAR
jgi:hypothetical protein